MWIVTTWNQTAPTKFLKCRRTSPHLLHLLSWDGGHYTIDSDFYTFAKLLDSLIYQCDEDVNRGNDILEALSTIRCALYSFIVHNAADYNNAEWII